MTLLNLLQSMPSDLSPAQVSRRAMRFLMHNQYAGRNVPNCKSLEQLMF